MAEPQIFQFILTDEGAPAPTSPGAAARAGFGDTSPRPAPSDAGPRPVKRPGKPDEPERFGQAILDAIKNATRYSSLGGFTKAGADLLKPILDIGQIIQDLRSRDDGKRKSSASVVPELPVAKPLPLPQSFAIEKALFNAEGAQILIHGGQIINAGGGGGGGQTPGGTGRPRIPGSDNLPAIRKPVPQYVFINPPPNYGGAARAALPAPGGAANASAGVARLGSVAASAVLPLTAVVVTAGAAALALRALHRRSTEQAKALAAYDATLAAATARAQVENIRQDVRSAQFLGRDLAAMSAAQNRISIAATRILDVVEKPFLEQIVPLLEGIAAVGENIAALMEANALPILEKLSAAAPGLVGELIRYLGKTSAKEANDRALARGDIYALFESYKDLDLDDDTEGQLGKPQADRFDVNARGLGVAALP